MNIWIIVIPFVLSALVTWIVLLIRAKCKLKALIVNRIKRIKSIRVNIGLCTDARDKIILNKINIEYDTLLQIKKAMEGGNG